MDQIMNSVDTENIYSIWYCTRKFHLLEQVTRKKGSLSNHTNGKQGCHCSCKCKEAYVFLCQPHIPPNPQGFCDVIFHVIKPANVKGKIIKLS